MRCPACHHVENRVLESRAAEGMQSVRRRRECLKCGHRFTTYERIEFAPLMVVQSNGDRKSFDRDQLTRSLLQVCDRVNLPEAAVESLVGEVEATLQQRVERDINAQEIVSLVLSHFQPLSEVAYIRYAAMHCEFADRPGFLAVLDRVSGSHTGDAIVEIDVPTASEVITAPAKPAFSQG